MHVVVAVYHPPRPVLDAIPRRGPDQALIALADMKELAESLLAKEQPKRWLHVQGVAKASVQLLADRSDIERSLLTEAAIVHDIGYASDLVDTGFHPIDGARYLRGLDVDDRVVNLVAHHSCARIEAELRGLGNILEVEFPRDDRLPHAELCFCDMTTGPDGKMLTIDARLQDIRDRYDPKSVVGRFVDRAEPELRATVSEVENRYLR